MNLKDEHGVVILEATYCIVLAIFVLMFLLSFGFFLYQNTMVSIVANEIASEISQTYKLRDVSDSSSVTPANIDGIGRYRYLLHESDFNAKNELKARNLASTRLQQTTMAKETGTLQVDIKTVVDDIGRRHYEVTVRQRYTFLLGDLLELIGQHEIQTVEATAYVESSDVLSYVNTVKLTQYGMEKMKELDPTGVANLMDSAISLLHSIFS